jgi:RimJ/RimL family protein N-acetyltransferase
MSPAAWTRDALVLEGQAGRLEPLTAAHVTALSEVGLDPELWAWTVSLVRTEDDMRRYVEAALAARAAGTAYPFATVERASGRVVGTTRYCAIEPEHRRLEIGYTFVAPSYQRTAINTEAKYLMLRHAFDVLGMNRVEFKTDVLNTKSRNALLGIGAMEEGVLRAHVITETGRVRDTIYFSILSDEWPRVRDRLEARMRRQADPIRPA